MVFGDKIFNIIHEIKKKITKLERDIASKVGLNCSETSVISCLDKNKKLSHTELVKIGNFDKSALSRLLSKMAQKDLIKSSYGENNKKTLYSILTEKGKVFAENIKKYFDELLGKYFKKGSEEFELFLSMFKKSSV